MGSYGRCCRIYGNWGCSLRAKNDTDMLNKWWFAPTVVFKFDENQKCCSNNVSKSRKVPRNLQKKEIQALTFCTKLAETHGVSSKNTGSTRQARGGSFKDEKKAYSL